MSAARPGPVIGPSGLASAARPGAQTHASAEAADRAARNAYGSLLARLVRRTGDIAAAEDALGDAFAKALAVWPRTGVPASPEAWLTTVAKRRIVDEARRNATRHAASPTLAILAEEQEADEPDRRLGLVLAASHPAIARAVHAPLILQTVFGVTAADMAPAFLIAPATLGQRLSRAKAKIAAAGIPFEVDPEDRSARLSRALDAVYALFTVATAGPSPHRARVADALELAALIAALAPDNGEALGLCALLAYSAARHPARRNPHGAYIPLSQQDPSLWDGALIARAEADLSRAARLGAPGPYQIEAAIQSVHCDRRRSGVTVWPAIATLYDALCERAASVGARVARAAAHGEAFGPAAGLALLERADPGMHAYQPYWAVRAQLSTRAGRAATDAYDRAIALTADDAVKRHLADLAAASAAQRTAH